MNHLAFQLPRIDEGQTVLRSESLSLDPNAAPWMIRVNWRKSDYDNMHSDQSIELFLINESEVDIRASTTRSLLGQSAVGAAGDDPLTYLVNPGDRVVMFSGRIDGFIGGGTVSGPPNIDADALNLRLELVISTGKSIQFTHPIEVHLVSVWHRP